MFRSFDDDISIASMPPPKPVQKTRKSNRIHKKAPEPVFPSLHLGEPRLVSVPQFSHKTVYYNEYDDEVVVGDLLGKGTYGEVRKATADGLNCAVKITLMGQSDLHDYAAKNEVLKLRFLGAQNRHTPLLYSSVELAGVTYTEMELLGCNLADVLADHPSHYPFDLELLSTYAIQLLEALAFFHSKGMVHGDIKYQNVCVQSGDHRKVKIVDYGGAFFTGETPTFYIYTLAYSSPENLLGLPLNEKTDVWSMAVVVYSMFSGKMPFPVREHQELYTLFHKYRLLPTNPTSSKVLDSFNNAILSDRQESIYYRMIEERISYAFSTFAEQELATIVQKMLHPEVSDRPSADVISDMLHKYYDKNFSPKCDNHQ